MEHLQKQEWEKEFEKMAELDDVVRQYVLPNGKSMFPYIKSLLSQQKEDMIAVLEGMKAHFCSAHPIYDAECITCSATDLPNKIVEEAIFRIKSMN